MYDNIRIFIVSVGIEFKHFEQIRLSILYISSYTTWDNEFRNAFYE